MRWKPDQVFIPPRPNPLVLGLTRWFLPACLRSQDLMKVEYRPEDLRRLRDLGQERVAIFPNHPTGNDPAILFDLAKQVRQLFYFMAARETFDIYHGLWGRLVQSCGGYSIVRGTPDRAAFKMTRELLTRPGTRLVVFPEGQTYSQNDSLLPFHSGITQLLFWALDDLRQAGDTAPVYVVPAAVKYKFVEDMRPGIVGMLGRLEAAVGLGPYEPTGEEPQPPTTVGHAGYEDLYPRIRRIGTAVVGRLEQEYAVTPDPAASLSGRMEVLKAAIVARVAGELRVPPRGDTLTDQMRFLVNTFYQVTDEEPRDLCWYDRHLREERRRRVLPLMRDLDRLANWIAVYDGYVAARPSTERMADLLRRLEIEALGPWSKDGSPQGLLPKSLLRGKQHCLLHLGEPINVAESYDAYRSDKRATVDSLTHQFEGATQALLDKMV